MKTILLTLGILAASTLAAQTANVIELAPGDTAKVKAAWDQYQVAKENWLSERLAIGDKYTVRPSNQGGVNPCSIVNATERCPKAGFEGGFDFSNDFRFIVPKPADPIVTGAVNCFDWRGSRNCAFD